MRTRIDCDVDLSWQDQAACQGTPLDWWFPGPGQPADPSTRYYCSRCPVADACRQHAIRHEHFGIWAGTNERHRQRIRRRRRVEFVSIDPLQETGSAIVAAVLVVAIEAIIALLIIGAWRVLT